MGDFLHDPRGRSLDYRDMPCAQIVVNFPLIVAPGDHDVTVTSGATRQIAGTQNSRAPIPTEEDEPRWMKLALTAPVPPGCALFRDIRAW